jgi:uncharacterized protein YcgL (UPF0745 family)
MYIYLRQDLGEEDIPEHLRERLGELSVVMQLDLHEQRPLARVQVKEVIKGLRSDGFFLQMPPAGHLNARLHFGD